MRFSTVQLFLILLFFLKLFCSQSVIYWLNTDEHWFIFIILVAKNKADNNNYSPFTVYRLPFTVHRSLTIKKICFAAGRIINLCSSKEHNDNSSLVLKSRTENHEFSWIMSHFINKCLTHYHGSVDQKQSKILSKNL